MVLLAGEISEQVHLGEELESVPNPYRPAREASAVATLPPRQAGQLDEAAALDSMDSDFITTMKICRALHRDNDVLAHRFRQFWAAETMSLMNGARARRMVTSLSAELLEHRTLSASRWRSILAAAGEARP
jgi:hypothetical protein